MASGRPFEPSPCFFSEALAMKQPNWPLTQSWLASRSLSSGGADPLARDDGETAHCMSYLSVRRMAQRCVSQDKADDRLRAGATSIVVKDVCLRRRHAARCEAGSWTFRQWRNAGILPVICSTSQNVFAETRRPATARLLCMGLFSIFWSGARPMLALAEPSLTPPHAAISSGARAPVMNATASDMV